MSAPESISPRGIPPIRPDWLVDVAWRLADLGLGHLRAWSENGRYTLEDVVDGERWRFESVRLSGFMETSVEHDADLYLPTDGQHATLRAGFQFTPWWDETLGRCVQARIEIGPRGPVTFDPENWFVLLPLPGGARPLVPGIEPGTWNDGGPGDPVAQPATLDDLTGKALGLGDLRLLSPDRAVPEVLLPAFLLVEKKGLLGRRKLVPTDVPGWVVQASADRPIDVSWTGGVVLADIAEAGPMTVEAVGLADELATFRLSGGALTLTGPGLHVAVSRPPSP